MFFLFDQRGLVSAGGRIVCIRPVWSLCLPECRIAICSTSVVLCLPGAGLCFVRPVWSCVCRGQDCVLFDQCGFVSAGGRIVFCSNSVVLCLPGAGLSAFDQCGHCAAREQDCVSLTSVVNVAAREQ